MSYAMVAVAGYQAVNAYSGAQQQKKVQNYQAAIARNNAQIADYQATIALEVGQRQEQAQRYKTAAMAGDQRAALAANGVAMGEGSAAEIQASTAYMGEIDALTIRDNAARQAWALREQGRGYTADAGFQQGVAGAINPLMSAGGSLLTSAGGYYANKRTNTGG